MSMADSTCSDYEPLLPAPTRRPRSASPLITSPHSIGSGRNRTCNLLLKRELLFRLSYGPDKKNAEFRMLNSEKPTEEITMNKQ